MGIITKSLESTGYWSSGFSASSMALNEVAVCLAPDGGGEHGEPARLKKRCDSFSALSRLKPKRDEWGRKLSK